MKNPDERKYYHMMVARVRKKLERLPECSYIRRALRGDLLEETAKRIEKAQLEDLKFDYYPPIFCFVYCHEISEIRSFEKDIGIVVRNSSKQPNEITKFLEAPCTCKGDRLWVSGMFEIFIKSLFLRKKGLIIDLDWPLVNGRNIDIRLKMGEKIFFLECTVITESDEDKETWDRFMEAKKVASNTTLSRPGKFDSPKSKSPSDYYDCLRFYAKVYDKLAKDLDPRKSQTGDDGSNILLISFYSPRAPLSPTSPGVGWALDELFADQPVNVARVKSQPPGLTDVSLLAWLDFTARNLCQQSRLDWQRYCDDYDQIVAAPRKLGAIILFDRCSLEASRVNYNANKNCGLSHCEMYRLEKLLQKSSTYCR